MLEEEEHGTKNIVMNTSLIVSFLEVYDSISENRVEW